MLMGLALAKVEVTLDLSKFDIQHPENFKLTFVCQGEPEPADIAHYKFDIDTNGPGFQDLGNSRYKMRGDVGWAGGSGGQILRAGMYLLDQVEVQTSSGTKFLRGGYDFAKELSVVVIPAVQGDSFRQQVGFVTFTYGSLI